MITSKYTGYDYHTVAIETFSGAKHLPIDTFSVNGRWMMMVQIYWKYIDYWPRGFVTYKQEEC